VPRPILSAADLALGDPLRSLADPLPSLDARTNALLVLRQYMSLLDFGRVGDAGGSPKVFRVPAQDIYEEQPDDPAKLRFPSLAFVAAQGDHEEFGLGPPRFLEDTVDKYGRGTVLVYTSDYVEQLVLEVWASHKAERRALVAGLQLAFRCYDGSYATMFSLPGYYGQIARVWLETTRYVDDPDVVRGRRRAQLSLWLVVPEVQLVRYVPLRPQFDVEVFDGPTVASLATATSPAAPTPPVTG